MQRLAHGYIHTYAHLCAPNFCYFYHLKKKEIYTTVTKEKEESGAICGLTEESTQRLVAVEIGTEPMG